jgi:superfamily II DNA or RNA helicase
MVFVPSLDLLYQTKEVIESVIGREIGIVGDGLCDIKPITISTIWSAANSLSKKTIKFDEEDSGRKERFQTKDKQRIAEAISKMEMFLCDECHMAACASIQLINNAAKSCRFKFGLSGTPNKFTGEDLLIEGVFGRKIIDIPASELIEKGYLVKPTIHFIEIPESNEDLGNNYQGIYKKFIVENEVRNDRIIELANKLKAAGRKTLILVKNIKHGEALMEKFDPGTVVYFVRGELDSDERNRIRSDFVKGKIDVIVASAVYDQGIDIANLDALILAGSGKSSGRALQRIGRVIRTFPGKSGAIVIDFIDQAKYLYNHSMKRLEIYRMEDGFEIRLPKGWDEKNGESHSNCKKIKKSNKNTNCGGW